MRPSRWHAARTTGGRPSGPVPEGEVDYGYLIDDEDTPRPDPRSRRQPAGVHERSRTFDSDGVRVDRRRLDRSPAGRRRHLRAARRHVHPRGHARRRPGSARPPALDRRGLRRAAAGERGQRHPQLGLRRRALVGRERGVRRPRGLPALRRRLPRGRARRDPGRRLQPPRPVGELPAGVRAVPQVGREHLGRPGQPRRRGLGGGAPLHPRQRRDVARRLPRRRPAARRRARARRLLRGAPAGGDGRRGGRTVGAPAPPAHADRGVRPQRPARWSRRARPAATAWTRSGATTSTTRCTSR